MTITIVVGPPCSGKSTYVSENKNNSDIQVDFDALAVALGSETKHASDGDIRRCTWSVRDQAIDWILYNDASAFIIHSRPSEEKVNRYIEAGCNFIMLDPGKEACLERCDEDSRPEGTKDEIENWYDNPPVFPDSISMTVIENKFPQRERLERFANMLQITG